jgi:Ca2+-binding RTX toxin-like protein
VDFGTDSVSSGSLALLAQGKLLVSGRAGDRAAVARLQPGGARDTTFRGTGRVTVPGMPEASGLAVQPDGKILISSEGIGTGNAAVARLKADSASPPPPPGGNGPSGPGGGAAKVPRCAGKRATIVGTKRSNRLKGTRRSDVIVALGGNDRVDAGRGNDVVCAGDGNDRVKGGSGNDRVYGQNGKDRLEGGSGKDRLAGGGGKDRLAGGSGKDRCDGGSGKDRAACERRKKL